MTRDEARTKAKTSLRAAGLTAEFENELFVSYVASAICEAVEAETKVCADSAWQMQMDHDNPISVGGTTIGNAIAERISASTLGNPVGADGEH